MFHTAESLQGHGDSPALITGATVTSRREPARAVVQRTTAAATVTATERGRATSNGHSPASSPVEPSRT